MTVIQEINLLTSLTSVHAGLYDYISVTLHQTSLWEKKKENVY